jgi:sodium/potassium-transporting ATPase subunit beta
MQKKPPSKELNESRGAKLIKSLKSWRTSSKSFLKFLYNHETREVIGRDGLSWTKVSLCYFTFYVMLGSFFIGMLAVFAATLSDKIPRYYMNKSIMASGKDEVNSLFRINPGLGFRPQLDPESPLIFYSMSQHNKSKVLKESLDIFLSTYYNIKYEQNTTYGVDCSNMSLTDARKLARNGFHCKYDYEKELMNTYCSPLNNYGYSNSAEHDQEYGPCVALKLNKIYEWLPVAFKNESELPLAIRNDLKENELIQNHVFIKCDGEYSSDRDAFGKMNLVYYSPGSKLSSVGMLPFYYYPYLNQYGYESPLVFVHFKNLPRHQLINIICRAYAANIDSDDKLNLRGMTEFQIFVEN